MTLWRLEILRLVRTRRIVALLGVYLFFGLLGPVTARYLEDLLEQFGGGVTVDVPPPVPADGILQFSSNVTQIGLLVVLVIAAGALAFDANPQIATFLRTRVASPWRLLVPRYTVATGAAAVAYTAGTLAAWYETYVLLGPLPAAGIVAGILYGSIYLAFAIAALALATTVVTSRSAAVVLTVVVLLSLPLVAVVSGGEQWLPSALVGALDGLAAGAAAGEYLRAAAITVAATGVLLALAARRLAQREI